MQILLRNGGKSAEYECEFKNMDVIYYPNRKVKYELGDDDLTSNLRCMVNLEYQAKYGDVNCDLLNYYIYFEDNKAYLCVENKTDSTFVNFNLSLTNLEMDRIRSITWH